MPITTSAATALTAADRPGLAIPARSSHALARREAGRRESGRTELEPMTPRQATLVVIAAMAGLLAACGSGRSDKAGGVTTPVVLRIAAHNEHDPFGQLFGDEVRRLSKGRIRVAFIPGTGENDPADADVRFAKQVRDGSYDLGVIEAAAWDELGVRSL